MIRGIRGAMPSTYFQTLNRWMDAYKKMGSQLEPRCIRKRLSLISNNVELHFPERENNIIKFVEALKLKQLIQLYKVFKFEMFKADLFKNGTSTTHFVN